MGCWLNSLVFLKDLLVILYSLSIVEAIYFCLFGMQKAELDKLLELTAIELSPDQEPVFLDYFNSMKQMFDEFYEFPLPEDVSSLEEKSLLCFEQGAYFPPDSLLGNVNKERLVNSAIEVKSAFWE